MRERFPEQKAEIEAVAKRLNMSVQELGNRAAIKPETMRKVAKGYQKASDRMLHSIRLVETVTRTAKPPVKSVDHVSTMHGAHEAKKADVRLVPIISWAAAGRAHDYADLENQIDELVETDCKDANAFALIVEGDSMETEIFAGDVVIFSPNSEPRNGDVVVARLMENHGVLLKRFRRSGKEGKMIQLVSSNPAYEPQEFPANAFRYIYPAVEMKRQLRK